MPTNPELTGQTIGMAHYATRAVLERALAETGTTFPQTVAINALRTGGNTTTREQLVDRLTGGLKIDGAAAAATVAELLNAALVETAPEAPATLRLTGTGTALASRIAARTADITARLYGGIPDEDKATTARVLTTVLARANAELGAA
ncbi:hypothetical protein [Streptomyces sp. NPDC059176]|uniref:hypothetical protein n=1 Tax=Streptomyces sp. NPDC059176 TaxID=3346758 RepID=UPI003699B6CD